MHLIKRKKGSQRSAVPIQIKFSTNFAGQGGESDLILESEDEWFIIHFDNPDEVRQLLSESHIVYCNFPSQNFSAEPKETLK